MSDSTLIDPSNNFKEQFQSYVRDYLQSNDSFWIDYYKQAVDDYEGYLKRLSDEAQGIGLPANRTPFSSYWYRCDDGKIIGVGRVRHSTNEWIEHSVGNIGFDIRPSERRKGFATLLLRDTLVKAREMGHIRVLLICDLDNSASIGVIEKNCGIFCDEIDSLFSGKRARRYWIEL